MLVFWIIAAVIIVFLMWGIATYNNLVRLRQMTNEGWSGIDIQLKRRYDLVPNLVAVVKQYAAYEKGVLEAVTAARAASMNAKSIHDKSDTEAELSKCLSNLFAVVENYPELKANQSFLSLQSELSTLENEIQYARRYYNGATRNLNIVVQSFPSSLIASLTGFTAAEYFQLLASEREAPQVQL